MGCDRVVDYFYTCGLDEHAGLEPFSLNGKSLSEKYRIPLDRKYKCRILQYFPEYLPNCMFDAESTSVVTMPNGLSLYTQEQITVQIAQFPRRHTFVITREDGSRVHGVALIFPVQVENSSIREAVCSLQDLTLGNIPRSLNGGSHEESANNLFDPDRDTLYTLMALGVLSRYHFIYGLFEWLEDLWASMFFCSRSSGHCAIEIAVRRLLYETVLPAVPGQFVTFTGVFRNHFGYYPAPGSPIDHLLHGLCHIPNALELTLFEYSLLDLLSLMQLDDFLRLLTCVLMEHRIILFSTDYCRLMLVAEGITCLLLPFSWSHVYAPILPLSLVHFVDAPVPYIMGIKQHTVVSPLVTQFSQNNHHTDPVTSIELASETNVCYVYIDEGRVVIPDEVPEFPNAGRVKEFLSVLLTVSQSFRPGDAQSGESSLDVGGLLLPSVPPIARPKPPDLTAQRHTSTKCSADHSFSASSTAIVNSTNSCDPGDNLLKSITDTAQRLINSDSSPGYSRLLHFNTAIRLIFLRNFADIFHNYEKFLVTNDKRNGSSYDAQIGQHTGLQAFDKVGFLSDQSEILLPFLSAFMETQMFASFLDLCLSRIHSQGYSLIPGSVQHSRWLTALTNVSLFEQMIANTNDAAAPVISTITSKHHPTGIHQSSISADNTGRPVIDQRAGLSVPCVQKYPLPDLVVNTTNGRSLSEVHTSDFPSLMTSRPFGKRSEVIQTDATRSPISSLFRFPSLRRDIMVPPAESRSCTGNIHGDHLRTVDPAHTIPFRVSFTRSILLSSCSAPVSPPDLHNSCRNSSGYLSTPIKRTVAVMNDPFIGVSNVQPEANSRVLRSFAQSHQLSAIRHSGMAQTNWDFIDTLLGECKHRIRRMVLKKMGQEAVELGHVDPTVSVVEENTLVSGLCDLLERIWSHELLNKSGKSALWSHLVMYVRRHQSSCDQGVSSPTASAHEFLNSPKLTAATQSSTLTDAGSNEQRSPLRDNNFISQSWHKHV